MAPTVGPTKREATALPFGGRRARCRCVRPALRSLPCSRHPSPGPNVRAERSRPRSNYRPRLWLDQIGPLLNQQAADVESAFLGRRSALHSPVLQACGVEIGCTTVAAPVRPPALGSPSSLCCPLKWGSSPLPFFPLNTREEADSGDTVPYNLSYPSSRRREPTLLCLGLAGDLETGQEGALLRPHSQAAPLVAPLESGGGLRREPRSPLKTKESRAGALPALSQAPPAGRRGNPTPYPCQGSGELAAGGGERNAV